MILLAVTARACGWKKNWSFFQILTHDFFHLTIDQLSEYTVAKRKGGGGHNPVSHQLLEKVTSMST